MTWRLPKSSWRIQPIRLSSNRSNDQPIRWNSSTTNDTRPPPRRRRLPDPSRGPPNVKHARLLGDGKPYFPEQLAKEVKVTGLLRSIRKQKHQAFAHIDDGTTYEPMQAVLSPELAKDLTNGAYVELLGKWQESPAQGQSHEMQVTSILHIGESNPDDNPIQKQSMPTDYLRTIPHLRIRTPFHSLLARTRSRVIQSTSDFFENGRRQAATQVHPPLITSSDCEGAGEVFTISPRSKAPIPGKEEQETKDEAHLYFREPKYLTVSSQLHLEAWAAELGDVWALSPTFRAEESDTARHLSEFYMLEGEFRGQTRIEATAGRVEGLIKWIVTGLRMHRSGKELLEYAADRKHRPSGTEAIDLNERWNKLQGEYKRVSYTLAIEELIKANEGKNGGLFKNKPSWDTGLQLEHERWIVENIGNEQPVFVMHYPQALKPFYMLPSDASDLDRSSTEGAKAAPGPTVACFDLLLPYGYCEVAGGSLREHRLENLIDSMRQKGLLKPVTSAAESDYPYLRDGESLGNLQWYADLRRFGSSPHGGFGLGFDRLLAYLTGVNNVRDVVGFPRAWGRAYC